MRLALLAVVTGCTGVEKSPAPPPDAARMPIASELFVPIPCTSGDPGDVSGCGTNGACCPFNNVSLSVAPFDAPGASLRFVAQPLKTGFYIDPIQLIAGPDGLHVENLRLVGESCEGGPINGGIVDVAPNALVQLPADTIVGVPITSELCLLVDAVGPYKP